MKQTIVFSQTDVVCNLKKEANNRKMESAKKCKATVSSKLIFKSFGKVQNFSCSNCQTQYELIRKD
jgi:hypothetical protein